MFSLENFVAQLGGLIGLYIGWSFLSAGMFLLVKLTKFIDRSTTSEYALSQEQIPDMINARFEAMQKQIEEDY